MIFARITYMCFKMGKNLRNQEPSVSVEGHNHNSNQGCIGGILHHLQGHKRLHVKKRLPYRKYCSGKHTPVIMDAESSTQSSPHAAEIQECVETKVVESGSVHKSSMKSRIISMFTDEVSKRKGRHRRTASCPVRTPAADTNSINQADPPDTERTESTHSNNSIHSDPIGSVAVLKHSKSNGSSVDYGRQSNGGLPVRDHTLLQDENIYAIMPTKYASLQESKLFWDALDLLNMRKELFLKILKDPSSSLVQNRKNSSKQRAGLTKSVSFPAIGSAERRASMLSASSLNQSSGELELSEDTSPTTANILRKRNDNKAALKRFKNIREKIKHVIRDKRKEKHMILMDGVLHKVPYGRRASKHGKADTFSKFTRAKSFASDEKCTTDNFKRTASFHGSFDKYGRLLESINNREQSKDQNCERLKYRTANNSPIQSPANLKRILSLPDLSSHSYFQVDDSESLSIPNRQIHERKLCVGSENKTQLCSLSESESQDSFTDVGENFDDSADSNTDTSSCDHDHNPEVELVPVTQPLKLDIIPENDAVHQDDSNAERLGVSSLEDESSYNVQQGPVYVDSSIGSKSTTDIDTLESRAKQFYSELFKPRADLKNQAEYNYVKDVLELAGFTRDELLGQWYSPENPLDPLVFNEVEGSFTDQPDGSEYEGGSWYQLLMFDLINEVLLSIYDRSFSYWPKHLTSQSHMHRMPKGNRVLEEVWGEISWFLSWRPENDQSIDDAVSRDLGRGDGWMNLQYDAECVGLEMEDLILDELLEEIIFE